MTNIFLQGQRTDMAETIQEAKDALVDWATGRYSARRIEERYLPQNLTCLICGADLSRFLYLHVEKQLAIPICHDDKRTIVDVFRIAAILRSADTIEDQVTAQLVGGRLNPTP